jgi:hypothetical protein
VALQSAYKKRTISKQFLSQLCEKRFGIPFINFLVSMGAFKEINNAFIIYFDIKEFAWKRVRKRDQAL